MSTTSAPTRHVNVKPATVRRALARIDSGTVRTRPGGPASGAPGMSPRTLDTLRRHRLIRAGGEIPSRGRQLTMTVAGRRTLIARGRAPRGVWAGLLRQELIWMTASGAVMDITAMHPAHSANAAAWLQRNAAAIRSDAAPRSRVDAVAWIDGTPLMRALIAAAERSPAA